MEEFNIEKGQNYSIKQDKIIKQIEYSITNDVEIQDTLAKECPFRKIRKINKYEYEIIETGERRRYKQNVKKSHQGLKRSMKNLRGVLKNNFKGSSNELFLTLTTEKEESSIREIKQKFHYFWKMLKKVYSDLEFVAIFEKSPKRNSWHIHMLIKSTHNRVLNIPNKFIEDLWGHGYTKTSRIVEKFGNTKINEQEKMMYKDLVTEKFGIAKLISYMSKINSKEKIPTGERCYEASKGIKKPVVTKMSYGESRDKLEQQGYQLKNEYTALIREPINGAIVNKVKTESWKINRRRNRT